MIQQLLFGNVGLNIGDPVGGGFFAGYISHTQNGVATHGLIVAPAASGYNGKSTLQWKTSTTSTSGTSSLYDGAANTANMADAAHPAANYCAGLTIGGYSDWYLPALYELEIAFYNFKPRTDPNDNSFGTNAYSVPARSSNYGVYDPNQTSVTAFRYGGAEAFISYWHLASTEASSTSSWQLSFSSGSQSYNWKTTGTYVRAFRKFAV